MTNKTIAFIGGGNMARSLIGGLLASGWPAERLRAADPSSEACATLRRRFEVRCEADNAGIAAGADALVLAVKPQQMRDAAAGLMPGVQKEKPLVVSIAAGIRETSLQGWLGGGVPIVRAMPNTPALVSSGATALYANPLVDAEGRDLAESLMRAVGVTVWVANESLMDVVTAVSGSGPAYFFALMQAMQEAGEHAGLEPASARLLTLETALGAARLALESSDDPAELRRRVTSPGGTTEAALERLEAGGFTALVREAIEAATRRGEELAEQFGAKS
ncbi:MAG: pyrroline-5-carboxylate reductase [Gammaproteobacteria bacterium]|nr:pyrroline-5-carboxylate reductase [Gammaproteobacteria bacterium]